MTENEQFEKLQQFTLGIHSLSKPALDDYLQVWNTYSCKRKALLTTAGEVEQHLYFVTEGIQRAFYLTEDDKEATLVFTYPLSFSGVADSFLLQQPSKYYLETLTASTFLRTSYRQVEGLMKKHHEFETLIRKAVSASLAGVLERQIELQCFTAEQKFRVLLKRSPHLLTMIPHKYIAQYLGMDATNFSKLLSTVRI